METSPPSSGAPNPLSQDRRAVLIALSVISALSWGYTVYLSRNMDCAAMCQLHFKHRLWTPAEFWMMFVMWVVMMVAMMVPSAVPMILAFAAINRKRREQNRSFVPTGFFLLGYLIVWAVFSALATVLQGWLHSVSLLSSEMVLVNPALNGSLLIAAGLFQWTPFKNACLVHCRSPFDFIMTSWREGPVGALAMGLQHGTFCLGCCSLLMLLLFVGGVMNIFWIALLTLFVLLEKIAPAGQRVSRIGGIALILWGIFLLVRTRL